jgi:hypothetical protein
VECNYRHRLPPPQSVLPDASLDVFGREKHSDYRDDMVRFFFNLLLVSNSSNPLTGVFFLQGGVGTFSRQNRTLYVGRIRANTNIEQVIERHFEEWGEIERSECLFFFSSTVLDNVLILSYVFFYLTVKVLQSRGVAFVTYVSELNAQFAKEAMMCQSLDHDEVINVRWATEDPNPVAKVRESKRLDELGAEGVAAKLTPEFVRQVRQLDELDGLVEPLPEEDEEEEEAEGGEGRARKRARIENGDGNQQAGEGTAPQPSQPQQQQQQTGLLSAHALDSLKLVAKLKQQQQSKTGSSSAASGGLAGLASYGSDDEDT